MPAKKGKRKVEPLHEKLQWGARVQPYLSTGCSVCCPHGKKTGGKSKKVSTSKKSHKKTKAKRSAPYEKPLSSKEIKRKAFLLYQDMNPVYGPVPPPRPHGFDVPPVPDDEWDEEGDHAMREEDAVINNLINAPRPWENGYAPPAMPEFPSTWERAVDTLVHQGEFNNASMRNRHEQRERANANASNGRRRNLLLLPPQEVEARFEEQMIRQAEGLGY